MAGKYATQTNVAVSRSRDEIEKTLMKYGATAFAYGWDENRASIQFAMKGRQIRFMLPLPEKDDRDITHTPTGQRRGASGQATAYETAVKARWRALLLVTKAKLEAVAAGIVSFEEEWLAHVVLPSGHTVHEELSEDIEQAYLQGRVHPLAIAGPT